MVRAKSRINTLFLIPQVQEYTMSNIADRIANLKQAITEIEEDAAKVDSGNKSAGTRVRKSLQSIVNESKEIRKAVLEARNSES